MGTWICHIRIAEKLLEQIPGLDEEAFTIGSLSPDSGYPNENWTEFDPPKEVTHFLHKGENESNIRDFQFYKSWLAPTIKTDITTYSFRLGYFFHLICDNLWAKRIGRVSWTQYADLIQVQGFEYVVDLVKNDWYGLDHLYLRNHPESLFWRVFLHSKNPPSYIDFIPLRALHHQLDYIREYYSNPDSDFILDRPFPYLSDFTMTRFIQDCVDSIFEIYKNLEINPFPILQESCIELLPQHHYAAYPPPLGDV
jgi:hypothetical protein